MTDDLDALSEAELDRRLRAAGCICHFPQRTSYGVTLTCRMSAWSSDLPDFDVEGADQADAKRQALRRVTEKQSLDELAELRARLADAGWQRQSGENADPGGVIVRYARNDETLVGQGRDALEATRDAVRRAAGRGA